MNRLTLIVGLLALSGMALAQSRPAVDEFVQGPERVGQTRSLSGTVIGIHGQPEGTCYVMLADRGDRAWAGLGGGGRFFLCGRMQMTMGQAWQGRGRQTGTRLARLGPRWRVLPVFAVAEGSRAGR